MPTLEDTAIDFPVTTLNDLLEAEAKAGVTVGADEEKYRKWAFISTGAAGLLAIMLAVVLVTGGSDSGGGEAKAQTAEKPADWRNVSFPNVAENAIPDAKAGNYYSVSSKEDGSVLADAAMLTSYKKGAKIGQFQQYSVVLAVPPAQEKGLITASANPQKLSFGGPVTAPAANQPTEASTTTAPAAPAAEAPSAPTPETPVPETSPATQPAG